MWYAHDWVTGGRWQVTGEKVIKFHLDAIDELCGKSVASGEFVQWRGQTEETLKVLFGENSADVQEFNAIYYTPVFLTCCMGDEAFDEAFCCGLAESRLLLLSLLEKIRRTR
jgi:hypothetical protein